MSLFEKTVLHLLAKNTIKKTNRVPMDEVNEIICLSNTAIGDTLFNTPIFRSIKQHYPDKKLTVVFNPKNFRLFETNPHIDDILLYTGKSKHFLQILMKLRTRGPKLILILHSNEPQATPLAVFSGAKYIYKIPNDKTRFNTWHSNPPTPYQGGYTVCDKMRMLSPLNIDIDELECRLELFPDPSWEKKPQKFLDTHPFRYYIGLQIGASSLSRMWFSDLWIELGKKILDEIPNAALILTGSPDERRLTSEVQQGLNSQRVFNVAGKFNLTEAASLLGKLDLLVTPDTGPLHIAAALGTPTVALYAVMDHEITNPPFDPDIHLYIQKPKICFPCVTRQCKFQECMLQIKPEEVFEKIVTLLGHK